MAHRVGKSIAVDVVVVIVMLLVGEAQAGRRPTKSFTYRTVPIYYFSACSVPGSFNNTGEMTDSALNGLATGMRASRLIALGEAEAAAEECLV